MSTTEPLAPQPPAQRTSALGRLAGVFVSPGKTFEAIARDPGFVVCWAVQICVAAAFAIYLLHRVGAEALMRQQLLASARGRAMDPATLQAAVTNAAKFFSISMYLAPLFVILGALIVALVMWGVSSFILGQEASFRQLLAVTSHAYLPQTLFALVSILMFALAADPASVLLSNPVGTNPGFFLDPAATSPFVLALATKLDLFALWIVVLLALGLTKLGRKTKFSSALSAVFLLWAVFSLLAAGAAAL